jgi:hypothetical protein
MVVSLTYLRGLEINEIQTDQMPDLY